MKYPIGSVSSGTMRPEDLIPCFWDEYMSLCQQNHEVPSEEAGAIERRIEVEGYWESEEAHYDLEWLFDALHEFAAPYFYFGSHPGNGADYGFWLSEGWDEDFDGLRVSDLSEVPEDYSGEVLHVNDHGNATLYAAENGKLTEIWGVV